MGEQQNWGHCQNNAADRAIGSYWEKQFCQMARDHGKIYHALQQGRDGAAAAINDRIHVLPDILVLSNDSEYHEIKHKEPTKFGKFGLEVYRYDHLVWLAQETGQQVMYTIHRHDWAGGKFVKKNDIRHWVTIDTRELDHQWVGPYWGYTWINGRKQRAPIYYWPATMWYPLEELWTNTDTEVDDYIVTTETEQLEFIDF